MVYTKKNIALLIFGRTVAEEASIKKFAGNELGQTNKHIAQALFHKTLKTGQASRLDSFISLSDKQKGSNFGERLANEVDQVFALGYEKLIIIGTDCPELSQNEINIAANKLEQGYQCVIGPAADEGAYLIGLNKKEYQREQFESLPWQTKSILSTWKVLFPKTYFLKKLIDIDSNVDLRKYLKNQDTKKANRRLFLLLLFTQKEQLEPADSTIIISGNFLTPSFRGPPSIA